jgi:hypothetical protein
MYIKTQNTSMVGAEKKTCLVFLTRTLFFCCAFFDDDDAGSERRRVA